MFLHYYGKLPETFNHYFVGQLENYTLILKEQIMENFLFSID